MTIEQMHIDLSNYCKDAHYDVYTSKVRQTLHEHKDINVCYKDGIYFCFALNQENEATGLELLRILLDYAKETNVGKCKLANAIHAAEQRVHKDIPDAIKQVIAPYLEALGEVDSNASEDGIATDTGESTSSSIEDCLETIRKGEVAKFKQVLSECRFINLENRTHKLLLISTAVSHNKDDVIAALCDMEPKAHTKATIYRNAGDICVQGDHFPKAEEYYNRSLALHTKYYVTYAKLGALYQTWGHQSEMQHPEQQAELKQKAIANYTLAIQHKPSHIKYDEVQDAMGVVEHQLKFLEAQTSSSSSSGTPTSSGKDSDTASVSSQGFLEELFSTTFSDEEDDSESAVALGGDNAVESTVAA